MNTKILLVALGCTLASADPPKIKMPTPAPEENTTQINEVATTEPVSNSTPDPADKSWRLYDNYIVKAHMRINAAWTVMEVKENRTSGSVSFTISRLPLVSFSVMRQPMDAPFETYMSSASLTPEYPTGYKKSRGSFGGKIAFLARGKAKDERMDESFFVADGKSLYQISFSAPEDFWKEAQTQYFDGLKRSFRWLP